MNLKLLNLLALCGTVLLAANAKADATWTGAADGDLFNAGNWSGTAPVAGTAYAGNLAIVGATITSGTGNLVLADTYTLGITNSSVVVSGSIVGVAGNSINAVTINNSAVTCGGISTGIAARLTLNSTLTLTGVNRAINSSAETSSVTLEVGSKIVSSAGNNDPAGTTTNSPTDRSNGLGIFNAVTGQSYAADALTPPLTDFYVSGSDLTPFGPLGGGNGVNGGTFTIRAKKPPGFAGKPEILVGFRGTPDYPDVNGMIWFPTVRTATDWQIDLDYNQIVGYGQFGFPGIQQCYLADINGDGISDKIMHQNQGGFAQVIATYSGPPTNGFLTANFNAPAGDLQFVWTFINETNLHLVFGDIDGDGIADCCVTVEGSLVGQTPNALVWGGLKSEGVPGISTDHGGFANFTGWSAFGDVTLGDVGMLGDFNGDGIADRLIYRTSTHQVFIDYSNPAGGWGDGIPDVGPINLGIAGDKLTVSDINGDGLEDLVIYGRDIGGGLQGLYGYYNDGHGFASLNGATPDIQDIWGSDSGVLFAQLTPPAASVPAPILALPKFANGAFTFSWNSISNVNYKVDYSTNLTVAGWTEIGSVTGTGGTLNFTNSPASTSTGFYRLRIP